VIDQQAASGPDLARKADILLYGLDPVAVDIPHLALGLAAPGRAADPGES
jgi:hypothetical protein